ncbi:hypothetical protein BWI92_20640 [Flectobacillus sp. BAB-3569]|nr:hypothetical protein BWI92_20640 [Flectobacillus sp. BAB-3569]
MAKSMKSFHSLLFILISSLSVISQNATPWKKYSYTTHEWQYCLDSLIEIDPSNAYLWQQKAMPYFKNGDYYNGMKNLNRAVELDTARWLGYKGFMECIFVRDYKNAIIDFMAIAKKQPNAFEMDHSYYFYIGVSYLKLNTLDSAEKYLKICISKPEEKTHYMDWYYAGVLKLKQKKYLKALINFNKCLDKYPNLSDANFYKAKTLLSLHRISEAYNCLLKAQNENKTGYSLNEDNMVYVNYPFQVQLEQIEHLLKK